MSHACTATNGHSSSSFSVGDSFHVPMKLHSHNRQRLLERFKQDGVSDGLVLVQGGTDLFHYDTDTDHVFQQESYFQWLFGVKEPNAFGTIDVATGKSTLFIEHLPSEYAVWMGEIKSRDHFKNMYEVDDCQFSDELSTEIKKQAPSRIFVISCKNTDSGRSHMEATFEGIENYKVDKSILTRHIRELRVIKSEYELDVMRYITRVTCEAHKEVMRTIKPGMFEFQLESTFKHCCYFKGGARHVAYCCIVGIGDHGSILHYGHAGAPNDGEIKDGDMCLLDMGGKYHCYCSDITCSYPANGKFTEKQKFIYETVNQMSIGVFEAMKPGRSWVDMHAITFKVMCERFLEYGLFQGGTVQDLLESDLPAIFQPHGLGHLIGLDTHDVGGYTEDTPSRPVKPGFKSLRTARILQPNMVITVEPGIYFIPALVDAALADPEKVKFLNTELLNEFRGFGGVRIEDNVVVTEDGIEHLSSKYLPRTVQEIEDWMSGKEY